ncbi:MAG: hypothetical protein ACK4RK_02240 [Gemmataceae bacterium]
MDWTLFIPIIAIVVFILSHLMRPSAEEEPADRAKTRPDARNMDRPMSPTWQEVERIREDRPRPKERPAPPDPRTASSPPRPRPRPVPTEQPTARPPRPVVETAPAPATPPPQPILVAIPVTPPPPATPPPLPITPAASVEIVTAKVPSLQRLRRQGSAAGRRLFELLRAPHTLQTAYVLQEVLGEPRCRRPFSPRDRR